MPQALLRLLKKGGADLFATRINKAIKAFCFNHNHGIFASFKYIVIFIAWSAFFFFLVCGQILLDICNKKKKQKNGYFYCFVAFLTLLETYSLLLSECNRINLSSILNYETEGECTRIEGFDVHW